MTIHATTDDAPTDLYTLIRWRNTVGSQINTWYQLRKTTIDSSIPRTVLDWTQVGERREETTDNPYSLGRGTLHRGDIALFYRDTGDSPEWQVRAGNIGAVSPTEWLATDYIGRIPSDLVAAGFYGLASDDRYFYTVRRVTTQTWKLVRLDPGDLDANGYFAESDVAELDSSIANTAGEFVRDIEFHGPDLFLICDQAGGNDANYQLWLIPLDGSSQTLVLTRNDVWNNAGIIGSDGLASDVSYMYSHWSFSSTYARWRGRRITYDPTAISASDAEYWREQTSSNRRRSGDVLLVAI